MKNILNTPAEVLALDVDQTLLHLGSNGVVPMTECLPDALLEAQRTMRLFLASDQSHPVAVDYLTTAGFTHGLFTPPLAHDLKIPSPLRTAIFEYHPSVLDFDAYDKVTAMYRILVTLGIPDTDILEAITGKRKFDQVVSFGDRPVDRAAAEVFGFRYGDVTRFSDGHTLSTVVQSIHDANSHYEGPRWLLAERPIQPGNCISFKIVR